MKIKYVETFLLPPRWGFVRIETDTGLVGWGEPVAEGRAETVAAAVNEMADELIGKDPLAIEKLWTTLYRGSFYRGGPILMSAIAGIDQALWDIKGKFYNAPVHEFFGGKLRDKMRVYTWLGGDRPNNIGEQVHAARERGFDAFKMNGTPEMGYVETGSQIDAVLERVDEARRVGGKDMGIAIDFHGRVHRSTAKVLMKELEQFRPLFVEEPVLPQHLDSLKNIACQSAVPIATGERLFSRYDFKTIFENGWVDVVQPDLSHCGGISEGRKIATMAEAFDVALAPHCPLGPMTLASSLHLDAVSYNALIQEQSMGIHYNSDAGADVLDYLLNPEVFDVKDGYMQIPSGPGLGLELNEDKIRQAAQEQPHRWRNPIWYHEDGCQSEW